jgi:hypothetical protein
MVQQVTGHDLGGLVAQERPPGRGRQPWRWVEPVATKGAADRRCRDLHTQALQFALDALVALPGVLSGQADDELLDVLGE